MTITPVLSKIAWDGNKLSFHLQLQGLPLDVSNLKLDVWNQGTVILSRAPISLINGTADWDISQNGFIFEDPTTMEIMVIDVNTSPISAVIDEFFDINITHGGQNIGPLRIMLEFCGEAITPVILTPADFVALQNNTGIFSVLDATTGQAFGTSNEPLTTQPATYTYAQVAAIIAANSAGGGAQCAPAPNNNNQFDLIDMVPNPPKKINTAGPIILAPTDYPSLVNYLAAGLGTEVNIEIANGSMTSSGANNSLNSAITLIQNYVDGVINATPHVLQTPTLTGIIDADQISVDLSWAWVPGANTVTIERSSDNGSTWQTITNSLQALAYRDSTVLADKAYLYRITEFDSGTLATSGKSNVISLLVPNAPQPTAANKQFIIVAQNGMSKTVIVTQTEYQSLINWFSTSNNVALGSIVGGTIANTNNTVTDTATSIESFLNSNTVTPNPTGATGTTGAIGTGVSKGEMLLAGSLIFGIPVSIYLLTHAGGEKRKIKKYVD